MAVNDVVIDRVLEMMRAVGEVEEALSVGVVFRKEQLGRGVAVQPAFAKLRVVELDNAGAGAARGRFRYPVLLPRPGVAKPDRRQQVQRRFVRTTVRDADADENVLDVSLRIFHNDVEVTVTVEDAGVNQLKLRRQLSSLPVLRHQFAVGK